MNTDTPTPRTDALQAMPYSHNDTMILARNLERDLAAVRAELEEAREDVAAIGIHTCHDKCQRPACVMRRDRDQLRAELSEARRAEEAVAACHKATLAENAALRYAGNMLLDYLQSDVGPIEDIPDEVYVPFCAALKGGTPEYSGHSAHTKQAARDRAKHEEINGGQP